MSNLNNNTTQLELLLQKVNDLPEAGSGGTDTSDATAVASEIFAGETAYTADGKVTGTFTIENELTTQNDLISQITTLVTTKAAPSGTNTNDATAEASDILSGKTAYAKGQKLTGTIATKTSSDLTASGATVTVPAGYYASNATKSVSTATQATPSVSIDSAGKITASATQTAGYVSAGTKTGTKQLTTQAAKTVTPSTSSQTAVAKNVYTTGAITVAAIPSKYEDVGTETSAYTTKLTSLETAITALETELQGKASGGSGGSSDGGIQYEIITIPAGATSATYTLPRLTSVYGSVRGLFEVSSRDNNYGAILSVCDNLFYYISILTASGSMADVQIDSARIYYQDGNITWDSGGVVINPVELILINDPNKSELFAG